MKRNVTKTQRERKRASTRTVSGKVIAEQALAKQAHKYEEALTKGDVETLDKFWTPDYTFVNPRGELLDKAQRMANIKSGATEFETMRRTRNGSTCMAILRWRSVASSFRGNTADARAAENTVTRARGSKYGGAGGC
jgi:hypothetical protein